jgi:hypothetical protein
MRNRDLANDPNSGNVEARVDRTAWFVIRRYRDDWGVNDSDCTGYSLALAL